MPVHVHAHVCTCVLHTYAREVLSSSAQTGVEARFSELEELAASRYLHLVEFKQLHQFERECDEVEQWIMEKLAVANNEELGKDLEHVEVLFTTCTCTALLKFYTVSNITLSNYTFATCQYGMMYRSTSNCVHCVYLHAICMYMYSLYMYVLHCNVYTCACM